MKPDEAPRPRRREWPTALASGAAAMGLAMWVLRVWATPLSVPFEVRGDARAHLMIFQGLAEGRWYYTNPRLGAPFTQEMFDYPTADHLQFVGYKVLTWLTGGDAAAAMNLGLLLGFFVIAATAYLVLRRLGVEPPWAFGLGVLFSLLPYHFIRGANHQLLSLYVAVPLTTLLIVRQMRGTAAFLDTNRDGEPRRLQASLRDPATRSALVIAVVVGSTGVYYASFALLLLVLTAFASYVWDRDRARCVSTLGVAAAIATVLLAGLAPGIAYQAIHGSNDDAVSRSYYEVEHYGLKPVQMVLPIADHRIAALAQPMERVAEGMTAEGGQNLGMIGAVGLLALSVGGVGTLLGRSRGLRDDMRLLSGLTIGTMLVAGVGGFAALLGVAGFTQIRAWNRISVFIAFFVYTAIGLWASRHLARVRRGTAWAVAVVLIVLGTLDHTTPPDADAASERVASWESDRSFVTEVEASLHAGAMVFQLPVIPFPEAPPQVDMSDYDLLTGYFHSSSLRWSYGGMRGRVPAWQEALVAAGEERLVIGLAAAGFDGLYIDRFGYIDRAAALEEELSRVVGAEPLVSRDGRLSFFDLTEFGEAVRARLTPGQVEELEAAVLMHIPTPSVEYGTGFYAAETDGVARWRWTEADAQLTLINPGGEPVTVELSMELLANPVGQHTVWVDGPFAQLAVPLVDGSASLTIEFALPPGTTLVHLRSDAPRFEAPGEARDLRLQVRDLRLDLGVWDMVEIEDP